MSIPLKRRSDLSTEKNESGEVDCRRRSSDKRSESSAYKLQNMDTSSEILQNVNHLKDCYLLLMLSKIKNFLRVTQLLLLSQCYPQYMPMLYAYMIQCIQ